MSKYKLIGSDKTLYSVHFSIDGSSMMYTHVVANRIAEIEESPGVELKKIEPLGSFYEVQGI